MQLVLQNEVSGDSIEYINAIDILNVVFVLCYARKRRDHKPVIVTTLVL